MNAILSNTELYQAFDLGTSESIAVIDHVPVKTLVRLVDRFPEDLFDRVVFDALYSTIKLDDANAAQRLRDASKERILSLLKDAQSVVSDHNSKGLSKDELIRYGLSLNILRGVLV